MHFYKLGLGDIVVFHDETRSAAGKVRVKTGGGIAGHNGLRSITAHVGNDYRRVRIGVGHPGDKDLVQPYVLQDFAKSERAWVEALCEIIADNAELLRQRRGRELPEQGASRHGGQGLQDLSFGGRTMRTEGTHETHGLQMRHRRPAECRQVDALQCADADGGGAGGELSVLHHRAECRRGGGAGSAARRRSRRWPSPSRSSRRGSPSSTSPGLVRGASKGEGLGNQFLANIREVDAIAHVVRCFEDDDVTHVEGKIDPVADIETIETELMLADLDSLEKRVDALEKKAKGSGEDAKEAKETLDLDQPRAGAAARRQAGAAGRAQARGGEAVPLARPADLDAGALCLQRRGRLGRDRQRVLRARSRRAPSRRARLPW